MVMYFFHRVADPDPHFLSDPHFVFLRTGSGIRISCRSDQDLLFSASEKAGFRIRSYQRGVPTYNTRVRLLL